MRVVAAVVGLLLAHSVFAQPEPKPKPRIEGFVVSPYLSATSPTGIRFTGSNEGFLIEKGGAVKRFSGGSTSTVLNLQVASGFERGVLGIAVDPAFATNPFVYIYHSAGTSTGDWIDNRLTRYSWNGSDLVESPFATPRTFGTASDGQQNVLTNHNGGPLVFGRDGKQLYGVTGDLNREGIEQNQSAATSAFTGGVYRLNSDGTIPADNPFVGHSTAGVRPWYAYGVRNSFGIAVDPHPTLGGNIWITENGPTVYDEINLVTAGMNSGWSQIMGPDSRDDQNAPGDLVMLPGGTPPANYQDPKFSFAEPIGITALQFLQEAWGGGPLEDALVFGDVKTGNLWLLRLNDARDGFELDPAAGLADGVFDAGDTLTPLGMDFDTITDIQVNPYDKNLYIVELGGNISRVTPIPEPHTWILSLAGLALVGWAARSRRALRQ